MRGAGGAGQGAQIICLQELFRSVYFCQIEDHKYFDLAEEIPGPPPDFPGFGQRAGVVIVASLFEKRAPGLYHNTAAIIDADGSFLGKYRKMHIPDDPLFYEKFYFTPGDLGFNAWQTKFGRIGVLVCWDQWYPEAARLTALRGAQILFYPTLSAGIPPRRKSTACASIPLGDRAARHAVANGCYVAAPNRIGHEAPDGGDGIEFWGQSFIADPSGQIIKRPRLIRRKSSWPRSTSTWVDTQRTHWPFLRDRRIDAYGDITKRFID